MDSIILLFLCLALGYGLKFVSAFPRNAHQTLNQFVIYVSLPSMALYHIPKIQISSALFYPIGVAWFGFLFSFAFFYLIGKRLGWSNKLIGCLIITAGLGNTSFIGFPAIEAMFGQEGLKTAIMVDQPGSFVVISTLGIFTATYFSRGVISAGQIVRKIVLFPPFIAFLIACIACCLSVDFHEIVQVVLQKLGSTVTPLALVSVGMQITIAKNSQHWKFLRLGLFFKLILTPAFFYVLYKFILKGDGLTIDVAILESAMPPMITGSILAASHQLKPKLSNMMISVGIPVSFVSLTFWYFIIKYL